MRPFKKIAGIAMSLALTAAMILPAGVRAEDTATDAPKIVISVGDEQKTPEFKADETKDLEISLKNQGIADAVKVRIAPVIEDANTWPFVVEDMNYERTVETITAGNEVMV